MRVTRDLARRHIGYLPWAAGAMVVLALALWMRQTSVAWLIVGAAGLAGWVWPGFGPPRRMGIIAAVLLGLAWGVAAGTQVRLHQVQTSWAAIVQTVEEDAASALRIGLDDLLDRGEIAVEGAINAAFTEGLSANPFVELERVRRDAGVSATAVYDSEGTLRTWAGEHRGPVPVEVRTGGVDYLFRAGPLFDYLYFVRTFGDGWTAMATVLLRADLEPGSGPPPFADRFSSIPGVQPLFFEPERARGPVVWDWAVDEPILSVSFAAPNQAEWRAGVRTIGRLGVAPFLALGLLVLAAAWYRGRAGPPGVPPLLITAALLVAPLGSLLEGANAPAVGRLDLPGPWAPAVVNVVILLAGVILWLLLRRSGSRSVSAMSLFARIGLAGLLIPFASALVANSVVRSGPPVSSPGGFAVALVWGLLLFLVLWPLVPVGRLQRGHTGGMGWVLCGVALAALLAAATISAWTPTRVHPAWFGALWAVPFGMVCLAAPGGDRVRSGFPVWLAVAAIAATAALPPLWAGQMESRLAEAETELARLDTRPDPRLDFLLRQFGEEARVQGDAGEDGVTLLYRSWMGSGLGREGYDARLTLWRNAEVEAELRLGGAALPAELIAEEKSELDPEDGPVTVRRYGQRSEVHYLMVAALGDERFVSAAVPPQRRIVASGTALAALFDEESEPGGRLDARRLTLIPDPDPPAALLQRDAEGRRPVRWDPVPAGWRSETVVDYPAGPHHAHLELRTPPAIVLVARSGLVVAAVLVTVAMLRLTAALLRGKRHRLRRRLRVWGSSFRGRITMALLLFFLLPTAAFGAVAYEALSREVVRATVERVGWSLDRAVEGVGADGPPELSGRAGSEFLLYRGGVLSEAVSPEVLNLGLYPAWVPATVWNRFVSGEEVDDMERRRLGGQEYLVAYRRLAPDNVLAAPVPLASGEIVRRRREFTDVLFFAVLLGGALSLLLAVRVGRALSRPIERVSRAAVAVGRGDLEVRIPEQRQDEFGVLIDSFNTMVDRLRHARESEARSARVLAWGQMARQVAHEIKNPLTPIKLSVQHLRRAYADRRSDYPEILDRNVDGILREIDRLSEISRAFARFGAPGEAADPPEPVDVAAVVGEVLALYGSGRDEIDYRVETGEGIRLARARPGELKEVLLNLLENARVAVDGQGVIRISAHLDSSGHGVRLEVADNGEGIPAEALPRIFEPQFSTRTSGTGLGLAIVRRLVESWGGTVDAVSERGGGTTVRVWMAPAEGDGG